MMNHILLIQVCTLASMQLVFCSYNSSTLYKYWKTFIPACGSSFPSCHIDCPFFFFWNLQHVRFWNGFFDTDGMMHYLQSVLSKLFHWDQFLQNATAKQS